MGKIQVRGQTGYILFYKKNLPLAVVEAKDDNHEIGAGMQRRSRSH
jgi:type I restriction enzyme, R subunit